MSIREDDTQKNSNEDRDLPGYPHYPPEDDIMSPKAGFKKISADEELANSKRLSGRALDEREPSADAINGPEEDDEIGIVRGTEADVTKDDLLILGDKDADMDLGEDEDAPDARVDRVDEEDDLDIPGAELDDDAENTGGEDEENNYYSLGGDRHEGLEEEDANDKD